MSDAATAALATLIAEALRPAVVEAVAEAARAALEEREPRPAPPLLDVSQVAERLGCCEETVRRLVKTGQLRAVTSLGHLRFRVEDVEAFIAGSVEP